MYFIYLSFEIIVINHFHSYFTSEQSKQIRNYDPNSTLSMHFLTAPVLSLQTGHDDVERNIKIVQDQFLGALWNNRKFLVADNIFDKHFFTKSVCYDAESNWEVMHGKGPEAWYTHRMVVENHS